METIRLDRTEVIARVRELLGQDARTQPSAGARAVGRRTSAFQSPNPFSRVIQRSVPVYSTTSPRLLIA